MSISWINTFVLGFAVLLALAALAMALWNARRLAAARDEMRIYARSLDAILREARRREHQEAVPGEEAPRAGRVAQPAPRAASTRPEEPPAPPAGGRVQTPKAAEGGARAASVSPTEDAGPASDRSGVKKAAASAAGALAAGDFELSLQPIVSVERGAAVAFEVFASVEEDGARIDIRRPDLKGRDLLAFERELLAKAIDAARRRIGDISEEMPLHVPVSSAFLSSAEDLGSLSELLRLHPGIGRSVVLSVPLADLAGAPPAALRGLADAGLAIAVEGWLPGTEDIAGTAPISMLKADAATLLAPSRKGADEAGEFMRTAAALGARPAAAGVSRDEEAIDLIERGIDLMAGERFARPRLLRRIDQAAAGARNHG